MNIVQLKIQQNKIIMLKLKLKFKIKKKIKAKANNFLCGKNVL